MVTMTRDQIRNPSINSSVGAAALALIILILTSYEGTPHPSISLSLRTVGSRRLQTAVTTPALVIDPKTVTPRIPTDSSFVSPSSCTNNCMPQWSQPTRWYCRTVSRSSRSTTYHPTIWHGSILSR